MKFCVLFLSLLLTAAVSGQAILTLVKQRPPELDVSLYKQVVVGKIVGASGAANEQSLDLTDALTSQLFSSKTLEVIDHGAVESILNNQRYSELQEIDEQSRKALNKRASNGIMITGRLQSPQVSQKLESSDNIVVVNGCRTSYWYEVKGDVTINLKIFDLKASRMIYDEAVSQPVSLKTKSECQVPNKVDIDAVAREAIKYLSVKIAKLVTPYQVATTLEFSDPGILKSPFDKLRVAVGYLRINTTDAGLTILKDYTESKQVKDKNKDDAWYNYGLGLLYAGKYSEARTAFQTATSLKTKNLSKVTEWMQLMEEDEQASRKMEAQAIARQKMLEQPEEPLVEEKPIKTVTKSSKPVIAAPVRKKKV